MGGQRGSGHDRADGAVRRRAPQSPNPVFVAQARPAQQRVDAVPVIAVLFLAAMVLGWIGFDGNMAALHEPGTFLDKLYRSAQLFVLHSGDVPPPVPWQLEVARFSRRP